MERSARPTGYPDALEVDQDLQRDAADPGLGRPGKEQSDVIAVPDAIVAHVHNGPRDDRS